MEQCKYWIPYVTPFFHLCCSGFLDLIVLQRIWKDSLKSLADEYHLELKIWLMPCMHWECNISTTPTLFTAEWPKNTCAVVNKCDTVETIRRLIEITLCKTWCPSFMQSLGIVDTNSDMESSPSLMLPLMDCLHANMVLWRKTAMTPSFFQQASTWTSFDISCQKAPPRRKTMEQLYTPFMVA